MRMKKLLLCIFSMFLAVSVVWGQKSKVADTVELPYKKYPELPAFNIRLLDSFNVFNTFNIPKGTPTLLVFFEPDCQHCKDVTNAIIRGMDSLSHLQMYWITAAPSVTKLKNFQENFGFAKYPNIKVIGRDYEFFFIDYFQVHSAPSLALYDSSKKFVHLFEGGATVKDIYEYVPKNNKP